MTSPLRKSTTPRQFLSSSFWCSFASLRRSHTPRSSLSHSSGESHIRCFSIYLSCKGLPVHWLLGLSTRNRNLKHLSNPPLNPCPPRHSSCYLWCAVPAVVRSLSPTSLDFFSTQPLDFYTNDTSLSSLSTTTRLQAALLLP